MPRSLKKALILMPLAAVLWVGLEATNRPELARHEVVVDREGPRSPWGKAIGDIDGDGRPDIVVGGHERSRPSLMGRVLRKAGLLDRSATKGELVWYQNPTWQKRLISEQFYVRTDLAVGDIDGDGRNDLVVIADEGLFWLRNPDWDVTKIELGDGLDKLHDVELADLDRDGDIDIVVRNQSLFDYQNGDRVLILWQQTGDRWHLERLSVPHGEGLKVGDLNGDGYEDIAVNDLWLRNPGDMGEKTDWARIDYTTDWTWSDVYIAIGDINADGKNDIVLSPSEPQGLAYRISWFEAPATIDGKWIEHIVDNDVESVHHALAVGDFDGDGDADIFSAEMNQGEDPDEVKVYINAGGGLAWSKSVLDTDGSHSLQASDIDGDGLVEVIGANWYIENYDKGYPVTLWQSAATQNEPWRRQVIGNNSPWHNLFVYSEDLDGDGFRDIIAGRSWFRNPGVISDPWARHEIGVGLNTVYYAADFDADGDIDLFGSRWDGLLNEPGILLRLRAKVSGSGYPGTGKGDVLLWAGNDGRGNFKVYDNIQTVNGDYPQGVALHTDGTGKGLVISWHEPGNGIHRVTVPKNPVTETWPARKVSSFSQDEEVTSIDLDADGVQELVTGTSWLDPDKSWKIYSFHNDSGLPDRHEVVDLDGSGSNDVVVGYQAISRPGKLAWYRDVVSAPHDAAEEFVIDTPIGPMSLSAVNMDNDTDIDLVVGEHNLRFPDRARLILYENLDGRGRAWRKSVLSSGDEHHNGGLAVDLDLDGDKDIVSIGWGHSNALVFENPSIR